MENGDARMRKLTELKAGPHRRGVYTTGSPRSVEGESGYSRGSAVAAAAPSAAYAQTPPSGSRPASLTRSLHRSRASTEAKTLCSNSGKVLYYLGEQLGRGAYGIVYKAIEISTGYFVAVKQIPIEHMGPADREAVRNEIELLSKLNHFNIVKYSTVLHDEQHISIVTEFMESGSLAGIVRRFGPLPETLIAWYVSQALKGLSYLHEQGVIHRDIKGANILLNKRAFVKLADFGVATKLMRSDAESAWTMDSDSAGHATVSSIAGSPYWMAPEIIEMSGYGTASDIWSIGCTVIELFTGYPPYYELAPMSALFRIVSDEHPPLPPNVSDGMADFLLQCFQKDAERRPSAEMLLRHPWLVKRTSELKRAETRLMGASSDSDEQEHSDGYLASRRGQSRRRRHLRPGGAGVAPREEQEPILRTPVPPPKPVVDSIAVAEALPVDELDDLPAAEDLDEEQLDLEDEFDGITLRTDERAGSDENTTQKVLLIETLSAGQRGQQLTNITENDGEITPQKKEDTRMGIAEADMTTLARPSPEESASADSMRARHDAPATMRSVSKPAVLPETLAHFAEEAETYDDLGIDDEDWLIDELEKWRHALHTVGFSTAVDLPSSDEADSDNDDVAMPTAQGEWAREMSPIPGLPAKDAGGRSTTSALAWYNVVRPSPSVSLFSSPSFSSAESDIEAGQLGNTPAQSNALNTFAYSPSGPGYDSGGTTNDRRNDRTERKSHHSDSLPRDRYERLVWEEIGRKISALVRADLTLVDSRQRAVEAATSMLELFREVRHQRLHLVTYHLLIPLMEVLDASGIGEQALVERILEFLNEAVVSRAAATTPTTEDTLFRDHLSIAGIVPILVEFSTRAYNDRVRMQAAYLLAKMLCIEFDNDGRSSCAPADPLGAESEEIRERRILPFTNESRERDLTTNTESSDIRFIETFVASRGLRAFVHLLEPDFERYREMTLIALRGVALVMRTESQRRRHDICRLLARDGFLDRLSEALEWCIEWLARKRVANEEQQPANADSPSKQRQARVIREEHIDRLAQRLVELWFLFPPADSVIEKHMARRSVLRPIVHILPALRDRRDQMNVLNSLRDLSGHQESHRALQASGAIPVLVGMLDGSMLLDGRIMITLFNLCRLRGPLETRERQEEAVSAHDGKLVRYLLHLARSGSGGGGSTTGANSGNGDRAGPKPRATHQLTTTDAVDTVATTSISGHFKGPIGQSGEHPLRGFAIEILCALDCSSERIRNVLWCNQVVEFLVGELLGSVVHWHRLRSNKELVTTSDASKASLNRGHDADLSGYEQPEALACAHKHVERTAPASSRLGKMPHGVCLPHLFTSQQKAILESLVTWMHAGKASLQQIETILVPEEPRVLAQTPAYISVLAELPFCTMETDSPVAAESSTAAPHRSLQWLTIQSRNLMASHAEYILGPYREMIEVSARLRQALSTYKDGVFCRQLARLALAAKKADVRRQALLMLSAMMQRADPEVLTILQHIAAAERSVLLQPEVKSILERFGCAMVAMPPDAAPSGASWTTPSSPSADELPRPPETDGDNGVSSGKNATDRSPQMTEKSIPS